jgi:hypothetical protein
VQDDSVQANTKSPVGSFVGFGSAVTMIVFGGVVSTTHV